jgi:L-fuconolactonase
MFSQQRIIDTHNHLWKLEKNDYFSWIQEGMDIIRRDFSFDDLQKTLKKNKVMGSILVQAIAVTEESEQLLKLADREELVQGVIGWCDISRGGQFVQKAIDHLRTKGKLLKGIRYMSQGMPAGHMLTDNFIDGCRTVGRNGLVYELLITASQLSQAIELVRACPDTRFVVEHMAKPSIKSHNIEDWCKGINQLAAISGEIYCKISGMVTEADWKNWKQSDFEPYMDVVYNAFGKERIMFGSDWPVSLVAARYPQVKNILETWLDKYPEINRDEVFYKNAIKVYRL